MVNFKNTVNPRKMAKLAPAFTPLMIWHFICQNASSFSSSGMGFTLWKPCNQYNCVATFHSTMAFIRVDMDHMTSSSKRKNIRQSNTIINRATNIVLNPPIAENNPPRKSSGFYPFQVCSQTWAIFFILSVISSITFFMSSIWRQQLFKLNLPQTPPSEFKR
jgi:hypothetical protein